MPRYDFTNPRSRVLSSSFAVRHVEFRSLHAINGVFSLWDLSFLCPVTWKRPQAIRVLIFVVALLSLLTLLSFCYFDITMFIAIVWIRFISINYSDITFKLLPLSSFLNSRMFEIWLPTYVLHCVIFDHHNDEIDCESDSLEFTKFRESFKSIDAYLDFLCRDIKVGILPLSTFFHIILHDSLPSLYPCIQIFEDLMLRKYFVTESNYNL